MVDYFIRQVTPRKYQIAKFEDTKEPTDLYYVTETKTNGWFHCDCQGFRRNQSQEHKHIVMAIMLSDYGFNHFDEEFNGNKLCS